MTTSINLAVIAPTRYLCQFANQVPPTIHYIAAHRVLHDSGYRRFYLDQGQLGASLVLDNGVFDLGRPMEPGDLLRAARQVGASEIVLPDVIHHGHATTLASQRA